MGDAGLGDDAARPIISSDRFGIIAGVRTHARRLPRSTSAKHVDRYGHGQLHRCEALRSSDEHQNHTTLHSDVHRPRRSRSRPYMWIGRNGVRGRAVGPPLDHYDTSRVALALARARIMGARYSYYVLADSKDGQIKEAEVTRSVPSEAPTRGNIRQGFVYERVRHVTLKSIANNAEIDVIWEKFQAILEPIRRQLNDAVGQKWEEWEIPREAEEKWAAPVKKLHAEWWQQRIARQREIDGSIEAKAEFEYLYDKPYEDKRKVRVAGPFTVESLSPHRVLAVDENDDLIEAAGEARHEQSFVAMILENLKTAGKRTITSGRQPANLRCATTERITRIERSTRL